MAEELKPSGYYHSPVTRCTRFPSVAERLTLTHHGAMFSQVSLIFIMNVTFFFFLNKGLNALSAHMRRALNT